MGGKSQDERRERMRRIANLFRERGSAEDRSGLLGAVAQTLGSSPTPALPPDPRQPSQYLDAFAKTADFAIFPRKSRRPLAVAVRINDKARAWEWLYDKVRTGVQTSEWRCNYLPGVKNPES